MSTIKEKLQLLRNRFDHYGIDGFIVPTSDPHLSEYTASHWKIRHWLSGFTGSAGTLVILKDKSALWTDSRYFIQATKQLEGSGIELMKEKMAETPSISEYILQNKVLHLGMDYRLFSVAEIQDYKRSSIELVNCSTLIDEIWNDRPSLPDSKAFLYSEDYAGTSPQKKIENIRKALKEQSFDSIMLCALDEIAWTLNIRGNDVHDVPVVTSFLFITTDKVIFFIDTNKLEDDTRDFLLSLPIEIQPYDDAYLDTFKKNCNRTLIDAKKTNFAMYESIPKSSFGTSPVSSLKAIRNSCEIKGIHDAMLHDGVALVRFLKWLKEEGVPSGQETELSVDKKLHEFRALQPHYIGESFDTIAGYEEHGAIVHYSATPETDSIIKSKGFLLIDSGAQYLNGTTDITRTIAVGPTTEDENKDYTLILKGHIDLAMSVFPKGTIGRQLDVLARMPIWQQHKNYLHGTGHGVGHFLSVHEGPQSIRMEQNETPLLPGMVTSNEPGIYLEGQYGIRIENLILTREDGSGMFGDYLSFETLTLCPIDKEPIIKEMMTKEEIEWFNSYHHKVYTLLSPFLNDEEKEWLSNATSEL